MTSMRAYLTEPGGSAPVMQTMDVPEPGTEQVLVRVRAAALNNGDLSGSAEPLVPGFEFSGDIVSAGDSVPRGLIGSRVMGIGEGAFAEYVLAHHRHVIHAPGLLSPAEAAALPTALTTEYGAARRAGLRSGGTVLITAATSGIALHGLQVARVLGAAVVIGTTRSPERATAIERAGADHVIVTDQQDLPTATREATHGLGADIVLDHVAGDFLNDAIQSARIGGAVVSVGRLASRSSTIDLFALAKRQVALQSVSYGLTPPSVLGDLFDGVVSELIPAVENRRIVAILDQTFPFEQLPQALDRLRSGMPEGKVTVTLG